MSVEYAKLASSRTGALVTKPPDTRTELLASSALLESLSRRVVILLIWPAFAGALREAGRIQQSKESVVPAIS